MSFIKALFFTVLFIVVLEFVSLWLFLLPENVVSFIIPYYELINSIIQLGILIYFISRIQNKKITFKKTSIIFYIIAIILGVGFVYFQSILKAIYYFEFPKNSFLLNYEFENLKSFNILASIFVIPFLEEFFFRGYIQNGLQERYNPKHAIFFSSLLFAFIHVSIIALFLDFIDFSFQHAYIAFFGGLISGILFYKSKSILPSIIFHIFWNLTVYVTFYPNT